MYPDEADYRHFSRNQSPASDKMHHCDLSNYPAKLFVHLKHCLEEKMAESKHYTDLFVATAINSQHIVAYAVLISVRKSFGLCSLR